MGTSNTLEEQIIEALKNVMDPELNRSLVELGMVKDVSANGGDVSLSVELTTPACPLKKQIEGDVREAVGAIPGVNTITVNMTSRVPQGSGHGASEAIDLCISNIVLVSSGKGGVGKSTVAVNLAVSLAQKGASVGLMDADIYGPNIPMMMGLEALPPIHQEKIIPAERFGVKVMSIGFLVKPGQPIVWRGPLLHSALQQFLRDVDWGELDYLIIDLPPGTGDVQLSLAQTANISGGIVVTLPQQVSLEDASRGLAMLKQLDIPVLGVIENMSYLELPDGSIVDVFGSGGGEKLASQAGVPFLGSIPLDTEVRVGGDEGKPIVISNPKAPAAVAMDSITEQMAAGLSVLAMEADQVG
jgi:ATP-binding protein involved in chromosome partitioning